MSPYWIKQIDSQQQVNEEKNLDNELKKFSPDSITSKTRACLSLYGAGIADRTISLQSRRFKTPRTDIKELIVKNIKTYKLSSAEIGKYLDAVEKISGKKLNISEINIDQSGFSLEVAKELGMDYLRGNYIIISELQKDCDIIRRYTSFTTSLITKLFESYHKTIQQILKGEALIGSIYMDKNSLFNIMVNDPESIFQININFDTPNKTLAKLKKIQEEEKKLLNRRGMLKNRKFLENLLGDIEDIKMRHGSLERIILSEILLKNQLDFYKLDFNDLAIYCIRSKKGIPIFIYFDVNNSPLEENFIRDDVVILNGKNVDSIDILVDLEIIGYSPYLGLERAINMIVLRRKEKLCKFLEKNPESSEDVKKFFLEGLMVDDDIREDTKTLLSTVEELAKSGRDRNHFYNLGKNKLYMTYPLINYGILYEILTRMENDEFKSSYFFTNYFIDKISKMNNEELKNYLTALLSHLECKEENNFVVNRWLENNRKEICQELGINFINNDK